MRLGLLEARDPLLLRLAVAERDGRLEEEGRDSDERCVWAGLLACVARRGCDF